jgi:hypothetical protein
VASIQINEKLLLVERWKAQLTAGTRADDARAYQQIAHAEPCCLRHCGDCLPACCRVVSCCDRSAREINIDQTDSTLAFAHETRDSKQEAGERFRELYKAYLPTRPSAFGDYKISASQGFMRRRHRDNLHQQFEAGLARVCVLDRQSSLLACLIHCSQGLSQYWKTTYKQPAADAKQTNTSHTPNAVCRKALHENNTVSYLSS